MSICKSAVLPPSGSGRGCCAHKRVRSHIRITTHSELEAGRVPVHATMSVSASLHQSFLCSHSLNWTACKFPHPSVHPSSVRGENPGAYPSMPWARGRKMLWVVCQTSHRKAPACMFHRNGNPLLPKSGVCWRDSRSRASDCSPLQCFSLNEWEGCGERKVFPFSGGEGGTLCGGESSTWPERRPSWGCLSDTCRRT